MTPLALQQKIILAMHWRFGRIIFIAFQAVWLNVLIPGHTRGCMLLPGSQCEDSICHLAHGGDVKPCCEHSKQPATPAKTQNCAICNLAANLVTPPPFQLILPPLVLLHFIGDGRAHSLVAREVLVPFFSCGPPALA